MAAEMYGYTWHGMDMGDVLSIWMSTLKMPPFPHCPQFEPSSSYRISQRASRDRLLSSGMQKKRVLGESSCFVSCCYQNHEDASLTKKSNVFSLMVLKARVEQVHDMAAGQTSWGTHTAP